MHKYKLITTDPHKIESGDIIKVNAEVYSDNIPSKSWNKHFIHVNRFLKVLDISNNGYIKAIDHRNNPHYMSALDKYEPIIGVYRTI